jgi:hypothetical protein
MRFDRPLFGSLGSARGSAIAASHGVGEAGFVSRLDLPIVWDVLEAAPCEQLRAAAEQANAGILSFLLHDIDVGAAPRVADEQLDEALKPIRAKLDVVIGMLARLSYQGVELPARCHIELGERHIAWISDRRLRPGAWLRIRIYFDATFREPVVVFARVNSSDPEDGAVGGQYHNEAELTTIREPILADLGRLALLVQRRQRGRRDPDTVARGK